MRYGKTTLATLRNDNGEFITKNADLLPTQWGDYSWIDYDKDHDLDLIVSGLVGSNNSKTRLYRNNSAIANSKPTIPTTVNASIVGSNLLVNWSGATDAQTPTDGLTYNILVYASDGVSIICRPLVIIYSGFNKVVKAGNCGGGTSAIIKGIEPGMYYILIQSIDNCFEGSPFSHITTVAIPETPADETNIQIYPNPSYGTIWILLNRSTNQTCLIELIDITGKCVFSTTRYFNSKTPEKFDLPRLSRGIYLIKVEGEFTHGSQKVIIDTK